MQSALYPEPGGTSRTPFHFSGHGSSFSLGKTKLHYPKKGQESTDYSPHHVNDHQERAYVRELMPLLNPHLHRMITLSFDLIFNSSLPRLFEDIYGDACPHLESLTLNCKYDDEFETIDPQIQMNPQDLVPLVLPSLTDLSINGRALALLLSHPGIMVVESDGLESLSVSCYTPREGESIDLLSFIKDFLYLTIPFRLRLDSIPFIWNPDEVEDAISTMDSLMDLTFHNLPQGAADVIFRLVDQQGDDDDDDYDGLLCINISECSLPAPNFLLMCEEIWLKDIEFPCDLAGFTSLWVGSTLVIENCPGYAVNAMLDSMVQMCPGFDWLNAPELTHLELINCRDFSIARLKHLWEVRENTSVPPPLDKIYVTGYGPMLSLTDRQWIERHPERLHFDIDEWND
ncbi:hypothetical protein C0995_015444 [Termitomyces sp. Mi166|nr:hypothetical protein C0995_015444 [Termitomyces sp. Mi166\